MLYIWILIFIVSLAILVKGADWFLEAAEKMGLVMGLSPFIVGVVIVGLGTSFPELISSFAALFEGVTDIIPANAIGSNIANILLVVGLSAIVGRKLTVAKSLIDLDLPLLAIATALFLGVAWDGSITIIESVILIVAYVIHLTYIVVHEDDTAHEPIPRVEIIEEGKRRKYQEILHQDKKHRLTISDIVMLLGGVLGLVIGAKYLIEAVIALAALSGIGTGVIALAAVAFGTSLPEIMVSLKAAWHKKSEVALGNIFGSNIFNILAVVGIPGLFSTLTLDAQTLTLGIPVLMVATGLFVISGISRRIHIWEGSMYILVYIFFIGKLFAIF